MITSDRINDTQLQICPLDIWKHCLKKFNVFHHDFFETKLFHADSKKPYRRYKPSFNAVHLEWTGQLPQLTMKIFQAMYIAQ